MDPFPPEAAVPGQLRCGLREGREPGLVGLGIEAFQAATAGSFCISVYTVSGRRIWDSTGSVSAGYNQILWDGRDSEGDVPASGAYVYRIELDAGQSGSASHTGILAVIEDI